MSYSQHFAEMGGDSGKNTAKIDRMSYSQHFAETEEDLGNVVPQRKSTHNSMIRSSPTERRDAIYGSYSGNSSIVRTSGGIQAPSSLQRPSRPTSVRVSNDVAGCRESLIMRNYIELFASTPPPPPETPTHLFEDHKFKLPTNCIECSKWLWGKGLKCQFCGAVVHKKCEHRVVTICLPKPSKRNSSKRKSKSKKRKDAINNVGSAGISPTESLQKNLQRSMSYQRYIAQPVSPYEYF